jgi:hypothetical protein
MSLDKLDFYNIRSRDEIKQDGVDFESTLPDSVDDCEHILEVLIRKQETKDFGPGYEDWNAIQNKIMAINRKLNILESK